MLFDIEATVDKFCRIFAIAKEVQPVPVAKVISDLKKAIKSSNKFASQLE